MEVNNKMKHTIKVAWAKGFSQFLALAGAILLVFVLFKFDAIMAQISAYNKYTHANYHGDCAGVSHKSDGRVL